MEEIHFAAQPWAFLLFAKGLGNGRGQQKSLRFEGLLNLSEEAQLA